MDSVNVLVSKVLQLLGDDTKFLARSLDVSVRTVYGLKQGDSRPIAEGTKSLLGEFWDALESAKNRAGGYLSPEEARRVIVDVLLEKDKLVDRDLDINRPPTTWQHVANNVASKINAVHNSYLK